MESAYKDTSDLPQLTPPEVSDVRISDVRVDAPAKTAIYIHGFADRPFRGFVFSNVSFTCEGPNEIRDAEVSFEP